MSSWVTLDASFRYVPSFPPSLLVVTNFARTLDGEDGTSTREGCLHVVVAFLSALPKTVEIISVNLSQVGVGGEGGPGWSRVVQSFISSPASW